MVQSQVTMENCIRDLLEKWGLSNYTDTFLRNGFDDINVIIGINENDLNVMGITCKNQANDILETLGRINHLFMTYISMDELTNRPSTEEVFCFVAAKFEREGLLPSGQDIVTVVLDKLESEEITLHPYNQQVYITKEGYESTRREYNVLRARFAQELFLPNQSVKEALKLIHGATARRQAPPKPPKPKVVPIFDPKTGKLVWINHEGTNYENVNYLYEFIHQLSPLSEENPVTPPLPSRSNSEMTVSTQPCSTALSNQGEPCTEGLRFDTTPSEESSPAPSRAIKKKPSFFQRFKHNLFGKSNSSLDSYLASSTKTLISDRSSECSSSRLGFFHKGKSKKEKVGRLERQRSNSAPEAARNVSLPQMPDVPQQQQQPVYARPYRRSSCDSSCHCCGPIELYSHVYPTQSPAPPLPPPSMCCNQVPHFPAFKPPTYIPSYQAPPHYPTNQYRPPAPPIYQPPTHPPLYNAAVKADTCSDTSLSSGSVSGDSAYSSKLCLSSIRSSQRAVVYGPLTANSGPLPVVNRSQNTEQHNTKCTCCSHEKDSQS